MEAYNQLDQQYDIIVLEVQEALLKSTLKQDVYRQHGDGKACSRAGTAGRGYRPRRCIRFAGRNL